VRPERSPADFEGSGGELLLCATIHRLGSEGGPPFTTPAMVVPDHAPAARSEAKRPGLPQSIYSQQGNGRPHQRPQPERNRSTKVSASPGLSLRVGSLPAGSKGANPLGRSLPVQLLLPTPKKTACSSPFATPLPRRDLPRCAVISGCSARKIGSVRSASGHCERPGSSRGASVCGP
jgi:hypothetical protein